MKLNNVNNSGLKEAIRKQFIDYEVVFEDRVPNNKEIKIKNYFELLKSDKYHR